jgi:hypothetical protein
VQLSLRKIVINDVRVFGLLETCLNTVRDRQLDRIVLSLGARIECVEEAWQYRHQEDLD